MLELGAEADELIDLMFKVSRCPRDPSVRVQLYSLLLECDLESIVRQRPTHATAAESILHAFDRRFGPVAPERKSVLFAAIGTYVGNLMVRIAVL